MGLGRLRGGSEVEWMGLGRLRGGWSGSEAGWVIEVEGAKQ
uniref:Uncharacterized protein n=1 Tax=viral metagenome TaxID=1070528 RepID=A0A6C0LLQ8_9ZZZZ